MPADSLGRGEKVGVEGDMDEFIVEDHSEKSGISETPTSGSPIP